MSNNHQDLDALPLPSFVKTSPERIYLVLGDFLEEGDKFSDLDEVTWCEDKQYDTDIEYVRADVVREIVAAELRKAQEWREPVGYIDEGGRAVLFPARKNWLEKDKERDHAISRAQQYYSDSLLYTSPPPKSDEAMGALIKAARWFADNPDSPKSALGHITEALAALAAKQKGKK